MITIILATALSCTNVNGLIICDPLSESESRALQANQLVASFTRICMSKVRADLIEKRPGGWLELYRECEAQAKLQAQKSIESLRTVDQNSLQR